MSEDEGTTQGTEGAAPEPATAGQPIPAPAGQPADGGQPVSEPFVFAGQTFPNETAAMDSYKEMQRRATRSDGERDEARTQVEQMKAVFGNAGDSGEEAAGLPSSYGEVFDDPAQEAALRGLVQQSVAPYQEELQTLRQEIAMNAAIDGMRQKNPDFGDLQEDMAALHEQLASGDPGQLLQVMYETVKARKSAAAVSAGVPPVGAGVAAPGQPTQGLEQGGELSEADDIRAGIRAANQRMQGGIPDLGE